MAKFTEITLTALLILRRAYAQTKEDARRSNDQTEEPANNGSWGNIGTNLMAIYIGIGALVVIGGLIVLLICLLHF